ncbi:MAG TPA: hypothetical protein VFW02_05295 [Candidatus Limnocylindrales bacterium]|nr:hypothetical protein [Candidatus Limnocylindrales bacterium]
MNPAATSAAAPVATIPSEPSPARSSDPGPIGSYTVVITAEDVAGSVSAHEVCENSGSFSLTIRPEGEWELLQSPAHGCGALIDPEGGGTWTADDDRIVFTDRGSFGCPAVFEYRWALNGDALTFSEVEDACPPRVVIFSARAWATVS